MGSIYENNISAIRLNDPGLLEQVADTKDAEYVDSIVSKTGDIIPVINTDNKKLYIHSRFDPAKEASRFISEIDPGAFDLFIVFGFGYGYHIEELIKNTDNNSNLLVLEKDPHLFRSALLSRDIASVLGDNRLRILIDPDEEVIAGALKGKSSKRVSFLTHRGSFQTDPAYYDNLRQIARSYLSKKDVNIATLSRFEKTWSSNISRNIREIISLPGANVFYNKLAGIPAVIAGAGPSLNKSIDFIRAVRDKSVIICVDTSYSILRDNGIIPHFCLTVDPQLINARYFEGTNGEDIVFIADPSVHPSVFRLIRGKISVLGMAFEMMKWIEDVSGSKGELLYGGSVTTNAYDFAKRIGASPVVMVGQDFAFTGGLAHARGSYLDEEVRLRTNRFFNVHMQNRLQLTSLPKIKVRRIRGGDVYTNQKLMIFINWFENRKDPELINASYDGAVIKGVRHAAQDEVVFPDINEDIRGIIADLYDNSRIPEGSNKAVSGILLGKCIAMENELNTLLPALKRAVSLSEELVVLLKQKTKGGKLDYILKKLSETDKMLESKNTLKDMIGFTVQRVIHTITEGYDIDPGDEGLSEEELVAKKSHYLYKGILEGSEFNMKILKKMIILLTDMRGNK